MRFERYGSEFTFYDYNEPEDLPLELKHCFNIIVADPPYLGAWKKKTTSCELSIFSSPICVDLLLKENESYSSLVATVKEKYRLDQFLLPTEHVLLTYELPDWMKETDEYTSPPLEIKDDRDVEVFMAVRVDCVWLELYVTYGDADVSRYRRLTAMEEGLILIANPRPAQQPLTRWRDSSRPPDTDDDPPATGGVIRLREVTDTFNKGDCSMVDKGKAIMTQDSVASVRNIVGQGEGNSLGGGLGPNSGTLASMNRTQEFSRGAGLVAGAAVVITTARPVECLSDHLSISIRSGNGW
uniref:Uncharacterized protein n=1 Tax=Brassica oleracea TaxID=3712 RepID=A0A3P6DH79_BRAOL|nr:unnamed protein product [Brassica oleracea]